MVQSLERNDNPDWFDPNTVFVIMSFDKGSQSVYASIKDECSKLKLRARRADELPGAGNVGEEIKAHLVRSEFIICDLTGDRPNVYYELGLAQGVGNQPLDIFLIAMEGTHLHFNVASFRVQYYRSTRHLRSLMQSKFVDLVKARRERE
jgi:hypothetical protein